MPAKELVAEFGSADVVIKAILDRTFQVFDGHRPKFDAARHPLLPSAVNGLNHFFGGFYSHFL